VKFQKRHGYSPFVDSLFLNPDVFERLCCVKTVGGRGLTHGTCERVDISFSAGGEDECMDDLNEAGRGDGEVNDSCTEIVRQIY